LTASLQSPTDIVNAALTRLGFKDRVGSMYEGSKASKKALDIYGQTRDQLLREGMWPFSQRDTAATLIKSAPVGGYIPPTVWNSTYPPLPWQYEYDYPDDCLEVRAVKPAPILIPNFAPRPFLFTVANDSNQRVILSNVANAIITYVGQVTDPTDMPPDFVEAFVASLARRLAPVLANLDAVKIEAQDEQVETAIAERQQG
jgi:hypothetical protein